MNHYAIVILDLDSDATTGGFIRSDSNKMLREIEPWLGMDRKVVVIHSADSRDEALKRLRDYLDEMGHVTDAADTEVS